MLGALAMYGSACGWVRCALADMPRSVVEERDEEEVKWAAGARREEDVGKTGKGVYMGRVTVAETCHLGEECEILRTGGVHR